MVMNSTTVMKVEEEETVMMKKKKNDDDDEEHGETNNNNQQECAGKNTTPNAPPDQYSHTKTNKKNKSCTTEAIMKHMLVPIKNLCIQSLSEDVCQLITCLGIVHLDGPKLHLLLSQVIRNMKMPGLS